MKQNTLYQLSHEDYLDQFKKAINFNKVYHKKY